MKYFTLLLLLSSCVYHDIKPKAMNVDALPVQFYDVDQESYNQKDICGVEKRCFCQPFNCSDTIKVKFDFPPTNIYYLKAKNSAGQILYSNYLKNNRVTMLGDDFAAFVSSGWDQSAFSLGATYDVDWTQTTGRIQAIVQHHISTGFHQSKVVKHDQAIVAGNWYSANCSWALANSANVSVNYLLKFYTISAGVIKETATIKTKTGATSSYAEDVIYTFQAAYDADEVGFSVEIQTAPGNANTAYLEEMSIDALNTKFVRSFVPQDEDICNDRINLEIYKNAEVNPIKFTDCLDIKTSHACTEVIRYWNNQPYAGINYDVNSSPPDYFDIRVPAQFWKTQDPVVQELHKKSNGVFVRLRSEVEHKRLFEIGFIPAWFHRKLNLILTHDNVIIREAYWVMQDAYERENINRFSLSKASVLLTENESERNVF